MKKIAAAKISSHFMTLYEHRIHNRESLAGFSSYALVLLYEKCCQRVLFIILMSLISANTFQRDIRVYVQC
jgi:hypothetical protein